MGKNIFWSLIIILSFFCLWGVELAREVDTTQLIRFHVLAHSDTVEDQNLKLAVKDEIITYLQQELGQIDDINQGRTILLKNWDNIEAAAIRALNTRGYTYPVHLEYGYFPFPVKYYGNFSLPAGTYESLRVVIGDGEGSNWWCVLFPPMCFIDSDNINDNDTPGEKLVFKCRFAEWWDKLTTAPSDSDISVCSP